MKKTSIALIGLLMGMASYASAQTVTSPNGKIAHLQVMVCQPKR